MSAVDCLLVGYFCTIVDFGFAVTRVYSDLADGSAAGTILLGGGIGGWWADAEMRITHSLISLMSNERYALF